MMIRILILILTISCLQSQYSDYNTLTLNNQVSKFVWWANKSTGEFHNGFINLKNGYINIKPSTPESKLDIMSGEIVIDMPSISCYDITSEGANQSLVSHLNNEDFFDTDNFPTAHLTILTAIAQDDLDESFLIKGNLTILDQTYPIEFFASCKFFKNEKMDDSISNFKAEGVIPIDRALYGVKYKSKTWYKNIGDHFIDDIFYLYFNVTSHIP